MVEPSEPGILGIVGGMGPGSAILLYDGVIRMFQQHKSTIRNNQFPRVHVHSPTPIDNIESFRDHGVLSSLTESIEFLNAAGSTVIAIPCNTVHRFLPELQTASPVPILDMINLTARKIIEDDRGRALLLATRKTLASGLYQTILLRERLEVNIPDGKEQTLIDEIILSINGGIFTATQATSLNEFIVNANREGVDCVVLGCTELSAYARSSYVAHFEKPDRLLYDSLDILVHETYQTLSGSAGRIEHHCNEERSVDDKGRRCPLQAAAEE